MMISIDEMAENAKKMIAGDAIVNLDPTLIDGSFVSDRIEDNDEDYIALRDAIKERGRPLRSLCVHTRRRRVAI